MVLAMNSPAATPSPATARALRELEAGLVVVTCHGCAFKVSSVFRAVLNGKASDHATPSAALAVVRPSVALSYLNA